MGDFMTSMYCRFYEEGHRAALASGISLHALVRGEQDTDEDLLNVNALVSPDGVDHGVDHAAPHRLLGHPTTLLGPEHACAITLSADELEDTAAWHAKAVARLQSQVAGPLVQVQLLLLKDTTIWKHGLLAMPRVC